MTSTPDLTGRVAAMDGPYDFSLDELDFLCNDEVTPHKRSKGEPSGEDLSPAGLVDVRETGEPSDADSADGGGLDDDDKEDGDEDVELDEEGKVFG